MKALRLLALLALTTAAQAHEWYPLECCAGNDCDKLLPSAVRETSTGYVVTVAPGSHPMVKISDQPQVYSIPYAKGRWSADASYHICLNPQKVLLCFFAPPGGV